MNKLNVMNPRIRLIARSAFRTDEDVFEGVDLTDPTFHGNSANISVTAYVVRLLYKVCNRPLSENLIIKHIRDDHVNMAMYGNVKELLTNMESTGVAQVARGPIGNGWKLTDEMVKLITLFDPDEPEIVNVVMELSEEEIWKRLNEVVPKYRLPA